MLFIRLESLKFFVKFYSSSGYLIANNVKEMIKEYKGIVKGNYRIKS